MKLFRLSRSGAILLFCFFLTSLPSFATIYYVATNGNDSADGTNWVTAKATIQAAIDVAISNDTVLVSNGVYATGGRVVYGAMTNRVAITNALAVCSVNGPSFAIIAGAPDPATTNGDMAVRCAYVGSNAVLSGFTLTNGATRSGGNVDRERGGGGAWCESSGTLSNCVITGNSANRYGGGVYRGTLNNCILAGNSSGRWGGGAFYCVLNNCTLSGNSSYYGGGTVDGTLNNCIMYYNNSASTGPNYFGGSIAYSCTDPLPSGSGNITNAPMLLNAAHIAAVSPCVGAGNTGDATGTDIDGEPWSNPPSMGCDEPTRPATGCLAVAICASRTR